MTTKIVAQTAREKIVAPTAHAIEVQDSVTARIVEKMSSPNESRAIGPLFTLEELPGILTSIVRDIESAESYMKNGFAWFYLDTVGVKINGPHKFNREGQTLEEMFKPVSESEYEKLPFNEKVKFYAGDQHVHVTIWRDSGEAGFNFLDVEGAYRVPAYNAPVVVVKQSEPRQIAQEGFFAGTRRVTKTGIVEVGLGTGRVLASLSDASRLQEGGLYWISAESNEVAPKVHNVRSLGTILEGNYRPYEGRTFEGVPSIPGHFRDNKDGTFMQVKSTWHAKWEDMLYVTEEAAAKVAIGEGPVTLRVRLDGAHGCFHRLEVDSNDKVGSVAQVASVPRAQKGIGKRKKPGDELRAERRDAELNNAPVDEKQ